MTPLKSHSEKELSWIESRKKYQYFQCYPNPFMRILLAAGSRLHFHLEFGFSAQEHEDCAPSELLG